MLVIEVTLNAFWILALTAGSFLAGFIFRSQQLASARRKIAELEKEIMSSHAEILELQREKVQVDQLLRTGSVPPVIPISTAKEEKMTEALPDVGVRKKLLGTPAVKEKS